MIFFFVKELKKIKKNNIENCNINIYGNNYISKNTLQTYFSFYLFYKIQIDENLFINNENFMEFFSDYLTNYELIDHKITKTLLKYKLILNEFINKILEKKNSLLKYILI